MTTPDQFREDLPLHAVGALPAEEAMAMERHLLQCAGCREELGALMEASAQIGLALPSTAPPDRVRAGLLREIAPTPQLVPRRRSWPLWSWAPAIAAMMFAVISLVTWRRQAALESDP